MLYTLFEKIYEAVEKRGSIEESLFSFQKDLNQFGWDLFIFAY